MDISVLGAGLSCIDVIKNENSSKVSLGGTAANVMSFLSSFSKFEVSILLPRMKNSFIKDELIKRNIQIIEFGYNETTNPIIFENIIGNSHIFNSLCPNCNRNLKNIDLPNIIDIESINMRINNYNLFFYDRVSLGIHKLAEKNIHGWNFFEPNSIDNYNVFLKLSKISNIVKFSNDRIQESTINNLLFDLQESNVSVLIITLGEKGLKYSIRKNGMLSEWKNLAPYNTTNIKDSSGAGDWLSTAFLFLLLDKFPLYTKEIPENLVNEYLDLSQRIAAEACKYVGAQGLLENQNALNRINKILNSRISTLISNNYNKIYCPYCLAEL